MGKAEENRTIAKNTALLYVRMFVTVLITLYTSRVILQVLGADDFGLYQTIGGIVGFLAFVNQALSSGTSRFITVALGEGDNHKLSKTFSLTFCAHLILALIIVLIAETVGSWYFNNKMVIPAERFDAATVVFHLSIVSAFISILQVPFNAEVIAHERLSLFAYAGIVEAVCKLGIVYLLTIGGLDRLVLYAILLLSVQVGLFLFYSIYCVSCFGEARIRLSFDRVLFKDIAGFSGWSLFSNGAIALSNQGIVLLLNLFFAPAVVTARTISLQVNNVATQFVGNFRAAANPQIVKRYAAGDFNGSKSLLLESTKLSYYLMLLLVVPVCLLAEPLLKLWLVEVPPYTTVFLQIAIVQSLFQVFDTSFYTALYATGRIKENALLCPLVSYIVFPVIYMLFKNGASPIALSWGTLIGYAVIGLLIKPALIHRFAGYSWTEIIEVFRTCFFVTLVSIPIPVVLYSMCGTESLGKGALLLIVSILSVAVAVWGVGLSKDMRLRVIKAIASRI